MTEKTRAEIVREMRLRAGRPVVEQPREQGCPECGAGPGEDCRYVTGGRMMTWHKGRVR